MIENFRVQVAVTPSPHFPLIQDIRFQVRETVSRNLPDANPDRPMHFDYRWFPKWLRFDSGQHFYEVTIFLVAGYTDPSYCLSPGDLLYWTDASPTQRVLRTVERVTSARVVFAGQRFPIAPPLKEKTFERAMIVSQLTSARYSLGGRPRIYADYWELR